MHYNEGMNIKLARQLIASELEEDEDADEEMKDDTEETEEISVDPPQEGEQHWLHLSSSKFKKIKKEIKVEQTVAVSSFLSADLGSSCVFTLQLVPWTHR